MGQGAEDADLSADGLEAHQSARRALYAKDEDLLGKVRVALGRGLHVQGDGSTISRDRMTLSHLKNSIARGKRMQTDFWKLTLPYLEKEFQRRGPQ